MKLSDDRYSLWSVLPLRNKKKEDYFYNLSLQIILFISSIPKKRTPTPKPVDYTHEAKTLLQLQMESEIVRLRVLKKQEQVLDRLLSKDDEEAIAMGQIVFSHL